jgi:hypothetical protein
VPSREILLRRLNELERKLLSLARDVTDIRNDIDADERLRDMYGQEIREDSGRR